ncbi:MAG: trigger factor [Synergistaceae bacterium]|nr:trigger factor [Synergistaceae bacterium]
MRTELLGQEKNIVRVKVEFDAAEFMTNLNDVLRNITQKANIPGFRKGRIPRKILEMRFGRSNIHKEALEQMLPEALKQVTDDYDLDIMDAPSLKIDDIHEGEPVTCELVIEVRPEVELPEFGDIEVEKLRQEVKDETLDSMIAEFRKQFATSIPVDRAAGEADVVSGTFVTRVLNPDGGEETVSEPSASEIDLGEPGVRPEVRDALIGKSKGDEVNTEFDVEAGYRDAYFAGKRIRYDIKVDGVSEKILPDMGPEFFTKVMSVDIDTEADFRQEMKKRLLEHYENEETERIGEEAIAVVMERSRLDVPDSLLERQFAYIKEQEAAEVKQRYNVSMEDYLSKSSISMPQYEQVVREKADATLRQTLVMDEIGKKFGVEVTREDMEAEISRLAALRGVERARMRAHYYKNEAHMSQLANSLRYDKICKLVLENVNVKHVDKLSGKEPVAESAE